jgi:hypothetical protein
MWGRPPSAVRRAKLDFDHFLTLTGLVNPRYVQPCFDSGQIRASLRVCMELHITLYP